MIEVKKNAEEQICLLVDSQTGKEIGMIKSPPIAIKLRDLYNAFENTSPNEMRAQFLAIIKRFEKKKAESEHALGFAVERLEAEKAEMFSRLTVLEIQRGNLLRALDIVRSRMKVAGGHVEGYLRVEDFETIDSIVRKARGEE